jgi:CMP-N-acetylneuraminic acid synthetase
MMTGVISIIPARGGSKGVPRKNLAELGGRPLLAWAIEVAGECDLVTRTIVSTEDPEIAQVARDLGAEVPFVRPTELALDDTPDWPVFVHAVEGLQEVDGARPDVVVWLRPTAPFRIAKDISDCIRLLETSGANAVRTVCRVRQHPYWMVCLDGDRISSLLEPESSEGFFQRQKLPPVYIPNGAVDVISVEQTLQLGGLFEGDVRAVVMPEGRSLDIDSETELAQARTIVDARSGSS